MTATTKVTCNDNNDNNDANDNNDNTNANNSQVCSHVSRRVQQHEMNGIQYWGGAKVIWFKFRQIITATNNRKEQ